MGDTINSRPGSWGLPRPDRTIPGVSSLAPAMRLRCGHPLTLMRVPLRSNQSLHRTLRAGSFIVRRLPSDVPALMQFIPDRWLPRLRQHLLATTGEERDRLRAQDFSPGRSVRVALPDGSYAFFRYAFHLRDEALGEVAVF